MLELKEAVVIGADGTYMSNAFDTVQVTIVTDGKEHTLEVTKFGLRWLCPDCEGTGCDLNEDGECETCNGFGIDRTVGLEAVQALMVIAQV